ncbi:MAG: Panacea domain-containing protein [bacterium]|nr:Panacea domain-containing protein [bacterium]
MIRLKFRAEKATQVAAILIDRAGGTMSVLTLVKLMYLIERRSLEKYGTPVIHDSYYNLPHGPIVSTSLNLINGDASAEDSVVWDQHISERDPDHNVSLMYPISFSVLSPAELELLDEIYEQFGHMNRWQLRDHTHNLPEWTDPGDISTPLSYENVLRGIGKKEDEIEAVVSELRALSFADGILE